MSDDFLPQRPFAQGNAGGGSRRSSFDSRKGSPLPRPASLSVNYVPTKFTKLHAPGEWGNKRVGKQGGGRDAFSKDASRMGMLGTVDDDEGVVFQFGRHGLQQKKKPKLRWNRFKWILFCANLVLISYGIAALVCAILVWLNIFPRSDVIRVGNRTELILSTVAASLITFTSLLGFSGIILNNRAFLAIYTVLLWPCLAFMVAPGYMSYKQKTFNLEGKINLQWSRNLGAEGRLRIQNALRCCGYFSPFVEATQSPLCYSRSIQPGCKARYLRLERYVLTTWFTISFALVPAQILITVAALLCSNHITYRFGKGLTPKRYRLDLDSMAVIMDNYATEIADKYGPDVGPELAQVALSRSSSNLDLPGQGSPRNSFSQPASRRGSYSNLPPMNRQSYATNIPSSLAPPVSNSGLMSQQMSRPSSASGQYSPSMPLISKSNSSNTLGGGSSRLAAPPLTSDSQESYDRSRESFDASAPRSYGYPQDFSSSMPRSATGQFSDGHH
ncbi:hypothetical protein BD324DRAFT_584272 [Kockovaella imperatae]|uniref:Tetraspanin Tsp2 n=1 Tax=Kockovaella imperatae TaxID=4999 RepID=A0A1Y1U797_9TREE|nr:hypothetical protein BD324DRAFT_584272 [Kockovaella imperatae]ORX33903.1 hypothetical protein BD324DRAFT_584272 [Kockovaella imperatae]